LNQPKRLNLMKHIYALIVGLFFSIATFAQLPDGSIAPDFTATDLDGVEHNLYDLLDEGKQVIIEFSATWCGPCWNYALTGTLDELHEMYGPDGTDEIRVFYIEADDTTTLEDLQGTGSATVGDWTSVVNFPIIDDGGSIFTDFGGAYYPTIYTVCPNRTVTESGQTDVEGHTAIFQANSCAAASLMNDPALLGYTGGTTACPGDPVNMSVELMNLGLANLGSCTIAVMDGATEVLSYDWSGDLGTYAVENVELGTAVFDSNTSFTIEITSADENTENNSSSGSVILATDGTSLIHVEIMIDNWPQETSWSITDASGSVVESMSAGDIAGDEGDVVAWWVSVPSEGCYTFEIGDSYGDGLYGSQWGSIDGYCTVKTYNDDLVYVSTVYDYDGSYDFASEQAGMAVTSMNTGITEQTLNEVTNVFPNPFTGQTNLQFSTTVAAKAGIVAYNLVGEQVVNLDLGTLQAGEHNHVLNFAGISAGVYLVALTAGNETTTLRVTLN